MPQDVTTLSLTELAKLYRQGELDPLEVTRAYLEKLEPGPVYRVITPERALAQAKRASEQFAHGVDLGPLQGVPIALKDLLDTEGDVTAAGSAVLAEQAPALEDCPAAARLDLAGAVFLGKTNMTELAFSGVGINPHFGTPGCALDSERIPGGSSSGSGVAVAMGLACCAIGSDTGGSVRIPAAFNGLVGLKTTDGDIPTEGCVALSTTLDTLGPMAKTVEDAHHLWRALKALPSAPLEPVTLQGLTVLAPTTVLQEGLDPDVAEAFERTCARLEQAGAALEVRELPLLAEIPETVARYGSFASHEALALYQEMLERNGERMDPRVVKRVLKFRASPASDYIRLTYARRRIQRAYREACRGIDLVTAPTVAILPPKIADLAEDKAYFETNAKILRNTSIFNFLGVPALSVPCARASEGLSVGFMLAARSHQEELLLAAGRALDAIPGA
jgi:aspartyl-tRNA(Asn)/glutamyl-tRNA(Gln) amidotransferase subunit A